MARFTFPVALSMCMIQALAAPVRRISSNLACLDPNTQISAAQTNLAEINVLADVNVAGPLLTAQLALFNASNIATTLAGFPPANAIPPIAIDANSQSDVLSFLGIAQSELVQVQVTNNAVVNKTTQNLQGAIAFVAKAVDAAQKINSECLSTAGVASNVGTDDVTAGALGQTTPAGAAPTLIFTVTSTAVTADETVLTGTGVPATTGVPGAATFTVPAVPSG